MQVKELKEWLSMFDDELIVKIKDFPYGGDIALLNEIDGVYMRKDKWGSDYIEIMR
jgi:hypothetical protein